MSGFGWRFFSVSFHSFLFYGVFIYRPTRFLPSSLLLYPFFTFISLSEYSSHQVQFHQSPARYATGTKWKCNILRTRNCFIISFIRITAKQNASAVHYKLTNEFHDTGSASTVGNAFTHKEMTCLYEKRRLITVFTKATVTLSSASSVTPPVYSPFQYYPAQFTYLFSLSLAVPNCQEPCDEHKQHNQGRNAAVTCSTQRFELLITKQFRHSYKPT